MDTPLSTTTWLWRALLLAAWACSLAELTRAAQPATAPSPASGIESLRKLALSSDWEQSKAALTQLLALGTSGKSAARAAVHELLARDRAAMLRASEHPPEPAQVEALEEKLHDLQKTANDNLKELADGESLQAAVTTFKDLNTLRQQLEPSYAARCTAYDALARRAELVNLEQDLSPATRPASAPSSSDAEAKLAESAQKALGLGMADAAKVMEVGDGKFPADRKLWGLRFYRICRKIEAWNSRFDSQLDAAEIRDGKVLNVYRECLGLWPLEFDARLIQSARRHSQEMNDLNYFAHESPDAAQRNQFVRARAAGYPQPAGENIAWSGTDGLITFWMLFHSPGHHKQMIEPGLTAMGIARVDEKWTQNFGSAPRLMLSTEAERGKAVLKGGEPLPPQPIKKHRDFILRPGQESFDPFAPPAKGK